MSSGTRGSSRKKASRHVYKERGSVRAFFVMDPYLNTSGKFSNKWVLYFWSSSADQSIYTDMDDDEEGSLMTFSSATDRSMHTLLPSTIWSGSFGKFAASGADELELTAEDGSAAATAALRSVLPGLFCFSKGESMVWTIVCIFPLVITSLRMIDETRGVPYGFHRELVWAPPVCLSHHKNKKN